MLPRKFEGIKLFLILTNNFAWTTKRMCYQHRAERHYQMSLDDRATCAAHPSHCSTFLIYKTTIHRQAELIHIC